MKDRVMKAYECDHMRPLVRMAGGQWYHLTPDGYVSNPCEAGAYEVTATYSGEHYVSKLVIDDLR